MKNKIILTALLAVLILSTALPAYAAVTFTEFLTTLTGDESVDVEFKQLSSAVKNAYARVGITPNTVLTVEDDGTGTNLAYKLTGGHTQARQQMAVNLYCNAAGTAAGWGIVSANYRKIVTKVYLSEISGTVQLYGMNNAYNSDSNTNTAGVFLINGGAYYYDSDAVSQVSFIEDGTLEPEKWYTVEAVFDLDTNQVVNMSASVYDENGMILGTSPMTTVSTLKWNSGDLKYLRMFLTADGLKDDAYVLFDDIAIYKMSEIPLVSAPETDYDSEMGIVTFTFDEDIDTGVINANNVNISALNPALDVTGKYSASVADDTISVDVSSLPYGETFTVSVFGYAIDGTAECEITTPEDPFESAVTDVAFADENGEEIAVGDNVVATVTLENASNVDKDYIFVVTSWNSKDECVAIRALSGNIEVGKGIDEDYTVTLPAVPLKDAGSIIRISLVDNWFNMTPIGDVMTYELGGADGE